MPTPPHRPPRRRPPLPAIPYDPWADLRANWPHYRVVIEPMRGDLLGEARPNGVIALREGSTSGQHRSTLAHEILHLERGLASCGPWQPREEAAIEAEAARRLITLPQLAQALAENGGDSDPVALGALLDVDQLILQARFDNLDRGERAELRRLLAGMRELWSVA